MSVQLNSFSCFTRQFAVHFSCEVESWAFILITSLLFKIFICCSKSTFSSNSNFSVRSSMLSLYCRMSSWRKFPQSLEMLSLKSAGPVFSMKRKREFNIFLRQAQKFEYHNWCNLTFLDLCAFE